MNIDDLADRLEKEGITNVYVHYMPEEITQGVLLLSNDDPIDPEIPNYRPDASIQAVIRHTKHGPGFALANRVIGILTITGEQTANMMVNYCRPRHEPVVFPRSAGDLLEWSVNFDANYVKL